MDELKSPPPRRRAARAGHSSRLSHSSSLSRRELLAGAVAVTAAPWASVARASTTRAPALREAAGDLPALGADVYSESVYADGVSADGATGFIVRVCRYPSAGVAWCWGHVFHRDTGCVNDYLPERLGYLAR
jgi:hypothetical protein